jgi:O-methyltransferase involved in polyketide biosynthesis
MHTLEEGLLMVTQQAGTAKIAIEPGSVQETLIIPLYGRKLCAEVFPRLYNDTSAAELCARLDYDFSGLDRQAKSTFWRFGALEAAMRQLDMEWEIRDYLAAHPQAAVVNMGCGLDQTPRRCDNGTCLMYNVDMPNIIDARAELLPEVAREHNIACDLNDARWMDEVDGSGGAIFFAAGVFHYFTFAQAQALVSGLAKRFGGCRIVFDTIGKLGRRLMRSTFKSFGMENYDECLCVEGVSELRDWVPGARLTSRGYMLGYYPMDDPAVTGLHRFLARLCDRRVKMQIVRIDTVG